MTEKKAQDNVTSTPSVEEMLEKVRSQLTPAASAVVEKIENRLASGEIDQADLDQLIATFERLSDNSKPH